MTLGTTAVGAKPLGTTGTLRYASSHTNSLATELESTVDITINATSHTTPVAVDAERTVELARNGTSALDTIFSFPTNSRTSLHLLDYDTEERDGVTWVTPWFSETPASGDEDTLVLTPYLVDDASGHIADIFVEYTNTQDGSADTRTEDIELTPDCDGDIYHLDGIPNTTGGQYRLVIQHYKGFNDIRSIDIALVH